MDPLIRKEGSAYPKVQIPRINKAIVKLKKGELTWNFKLPPDLHYREYECKIRIFHESESSSLLNDILIKISNVNK